MAQELQLVQHQSGFLFPATPESREFLQSKSVQTIEASGVVNIDLPHLHKVYPKTYNTWRGMKDRCNNPNHSMYKYYGGKAIRIVDRWNSFKNFISDMGTRPDKHVIDRIDPLANYCLSNCRWVSHTHSATNRKGWSQSGLRGVSQRKSGRYAAVMRVDGSTITIGTFDTPELAALAYDHAARQMYGEFATLNLPAKGGE